MTNGNHDTTIMDAEQFASYLEKRLELFEAIEPLNRDGMQLRLRVTGEPVEADLTNFYDAYLRNPGQIDAVVQTFARVLLGEIPERSEADYTILADRVYPMLKKHDILLLVADRKLPALVYRDFLANLIITYVIDEPNSVAYINEAHLERWNLTVQDLHEQALDNLRQRTAGIDSVTTGTGDQRLFIFSSGDGYDATRLLLADVLAGWARSVRGNLVIGIPNRDFLIAFSDNDPDVLTNIAMQVQSDSAQRDHGLTEQLFTISDSQIQQYEWE